MNDRRHGLYGIAQSVEQPLSPAQGQIHEFWVQRQQPLKYGV
jgi:hypothetical protein